jgi:phosphohistidine phosphatase SixA
MFLICITHAQARSVSLSQFRALTSTGRDEVVNAAKQFEQDGLRLITDQHLRIDAVVTSPEARCAETVLVFADALREHTATSQVEIDRRLMPPTGSPINKDALEKVATTHPAAQGKKAVVVGLHGDLIVALPDPNVIPHKYRTRDPNWFRQGPVVAVIMHVPGKPWSNAKVIYCRWPIDTRWQDLLAE